MLRSLSMPALLIAAAIISAVGCQACNSCYDYARPVADCQCNCCGCGRSGSAFSGCGCNSGGCSTGGCSCNGGGGQVMEEGAVEQAPTPQAMPQNGRVMNQAPTQ
jgi:hypothetical protein